MVYYYGQKSIAPRLTTGRDQYLVPQNPPHSRFSAPFDPGNNQSIMTQPAMAQPETVHPTLAGCKAMVFDLMGTCCDWHTGIVKAMEKLPDVHGLPSREYDRFALDWRKEFFQEIDARFEQGLPHENIDRTHRRILDHLLDRRDGMEKWEEGHRQSLIDAWHVQRAWPDVIRALDRLRHHTTFFLVVLANGTTRLQLDIVRSAGLPFHTLFSSELLGLTKPDPAMYRKAIQLMGLEPEECIMVASHAYDLIAAKKVGMKTVYIKRETEDVDAEIQALFGDYAGDNKADAWFDGSEGTEACGMVKFVSALGVSDYLPYVRVGTE